MKHVKIIWWFHLLAVKHTFTRIQTCCSLTADHQLRNPRIEQLLLNNS